MGLCRYTVRFVDGGSVIVHADPDQLRQQLFEVRHMNRHDMALMVHEGLIWLGSVSAIMETPTSGTPGWWKQQWRRVRKPKHEPKQPVEPSGDEGVPVDAVTRDDLNLEAALKAAREETVETHG